MKTSRRNFIKKLAKLGGFSLFFPNVLRYNRKNIQSFRKNKNDEIWSPGYIKLENEGVLEKRVDELYSIFESCHLCPRSCGANRLNGEKGFCRATSQLMVASAHQHFGEETPLVGKYGSGTIFFTHCGLRCVFCLNYHINHLGEGEEITETKLAQFMMKLQRLGCRNINVVTPIHYVPNIVKALRVAVKSGLRIPLVYNTSGYERLETLKLLDGIVDIYLPDFKYMDGKNAEKYSSGAYDYPEYAKKAILEMHRQVGELVTDEEGNALRGLIIRHLVMPNNIAGTDKFVSWVAENLPKTTFVNIMSQYQPLFKAFDYPEISRRITIKEYKQAISWAKKAGLKNLYHDL